MNQAITIRPARPADSDLVASLIYLTMGIEADWLFGQQKGHSTLQVLADLHRQKDNRLSHTHAHLAVRDGQPVGLLQSFPGGILSRLDRLTGWCLLKIMGLSATLRLARLQSAYGDLKETETDEFYISNLAVFPAFEGLGIASRLMGFAEDLARASGMRKCSLIVAFGHDHAYRMYEHLGYKVVRSYLNRHPKVAEGSGGYHKMVKMLSLHSDIG